MELDARYLRNIPDAPRVSGDLSGWDRASPFLNMSKRRSSSGDEFGQDLDNRTGKYDLDNVELNDADFRTDDLEFQPAAAVVTANSKGHSRTMSRGGDYHMSTSSSSEEIKRIKSQMTEEQEPPPRSTSRGGGGIVENAREP